MKINIDQEWLLKMAEKEDNGITSVGGLIMRLGECSICEIPLVRKDMRWCSLCHRECCPECCPGILCKNCMKLVQEPPAGEAEHDPTE